MMYDNISVSSKGTTIINGAYAHYYIVKEGYLEGPDNLHSLCVNCNQQVTMVRGKKAQQAFTFKCPRCRWDNLYNPKTKMFYQIRDGDGSVDFFYKKIGTNHKGTRHVNKDQNGRVDTWIKDKSETREERDAVEKTDYLQKFASVELKQALDEEAQRRGLPVKAEENDFVDIFGKE